MAFYRPIIIEISAGDKEIPVILYPDTQISKIVDRKKHRVIEDHIMRVYEENKNRFSTLGKYNIDILWKDGNDLMTDVWVYDKITEWNEQQADSGPLVDAEYTFRNLERDTKSGIGAGLGMMISGMEDVQRRKAEQKLGKNSSVNDILKEYIYGSRPELNFGPGLDFTPKEDFYQ